MTAQAHSQPSPAARALALEIARCPEVEACATNPKHACREVVSVQGEPLRPDRQVPEAWAGNLETARILYLSSNPSISEAGDSNSGSAAEDYPLTNWPDERIAEFLTRRFDPSVQPPWVENERFLRVDGERAPRRTAYWREARKRSTEVLGREADPARDYALTEVVRCKSKRERGVASAAAMCSSRYLDRTLALCPAPLVVVVGTKARDQVVTLMALPPGFGERGAPPERNLAVVSLGGHDRVVAYLPHFTGMEPGGKSFHARFDASIVSRLGAVARGEEVASSLNER